MIGASYVPATAVNQLEMWQAATFDLQRIDLELGWAENIGMNTLRVPLHDLLWQPDSEGFRKRIEEFLRIASKHKMRVMFVLFDSTGDPAPKPGPQQPPQPGVRNARWLQSPGAKALADPAEAQQLENYIKGVVGAFANDKRVIAWDLWNEPDDSPAVAAILPKVFEWARAVHPKQPLTSAVWRGDWSAPDKLRPVEKIQLDSSDIISFHDFASVDDFSQRVRWLEEYNRPVFCTAFLARPAKSTIESILRTAKDQKVAVFTASLVQGKTQTYLPPDSVDHPSTDHEPSTWWQDIFRNDGKPYRPEETGLIRTLVHEKDKK